VNNLLETAGAQLSAVEKLSGKHVLGPFECGKPSLDDWLKRYALANQKMDSSQTYVVQRNSVVVGYYSSTVGSVSEKEAPSRIGRVCLIIQ